MLVEDDKKESTKMIPVLMMSASHDAAKTCKASGADKFIYKPFEMDELLAMVEKIIIV